MNYDPSLCGFGKSTRTFTKINSGKSNVIYAAISIEQANDARDKNKAIYISRPSDIIHSKVEESCTAIFCKKVKVNSCIVTTHNTLFNAMMSKKLDLSKTEVFIDELPNYFVKPHSIGCTFETYKLVTEFIEFEKHDGTYSKIKLKEQKIEIIEKILKNGNDEFWKASEATNFAAFLLSLCHSTYINTQNIIELKKLTPNGECKQLQALSVLTVEAISQFKSFNVLSALFQHTATFHFMKMFGHVFNDISGITTKSQHNKELVIEYFIPKYSGTKRDKPLMSDIDTTVGSRIAEEQMKLADKSSIVYSNKVLRKIYTEQGYKVLDTVYGHNSYSEYTTAIYNSTTLPKPPILSTMCNFGATTEMIYTEYGYLVAYQFLMRTALRKTNSNEPCRLICVDEKTAKFIGKLFTKTQLVHHDIKIINHSIGIKSDKKPIPIHARKKKSQFEKNYKRNKDLLQSKNKNTIKSIKNYIDIVEAHYKDSERLFDFEKYKKLI